MNDFIVSILASSAGTTALLGIIAFLGRSWIETRLTKSVQHEFDRKLAAFKDKLDAETRRNEAVRNAGFSAMLAQRSALAGKRVEAAHALWNGVLEARKATGLLLTMEVLNIEEVVKSLDDPKIIGYLKMIASGEVMSDEYLSRLIKVAEHQPWVSPLAWSLYAVYSTLVAYSVHKMKLLQVGVDPSRFMKANHWVTLLTPALLDEDVRKIGKERNADLQWALKRVEDRIVGEIRNSLEAETIGADTLAVAQRMSEQVQRLDAESNLIEHKQQASLAGKQAGVDASQLSQA